MRIFVTGYIDTDELEDDQVDLAHETGLSAEGFEAMRSTLSAHLDDLEFNLEA